MASPGMIVDRARGSTHNVRVLGAGRFPITTAGDARDELYKLSVYAG